MGFRAAETENVSCHFSHHFIELVGDGLTVVDDQICPYSRLEQAGNVGIFKFVQVEIESGVLSLYLPVLSRTIKVIMTKTSWALPMSALGNVMVFALVTSDL